VSFATFVTNNVAMKILSQRVIHFGMKGGFIVTSALSNIQKVQAEN